MRAYWLAPPCGYWPPFPGDTNRGALPISPEATPGGYTVLRARLPDGLPRAAIYSAIFRLPVTPGGQVLEYMNLSVEVLLDVSTLRMCMGKGTECSLRVLEL